MLTLPAPNPINGATLRTELEAAGFPLGRFDMVMVGNELQFATIDPAAKRVVAKVLAAHNGQPPEPEPTVEDRLIAIEAALTAAVGIDFDSSQ
jgi:hypothetical protein